MMWQRPRGQRIHVRAGSAPRAVRGPKACESTPGAAPLLPRWMPTRAATTPRCTCRRPIAAGRRRPQRFADAVGMGADGKVGRDDDGWAANRRYCHRRRRTCAPAAASASSRAPRSLRCDRRGSSRYPLDHSPVQPARGARRRAVSQPPPGHRRCRGAWEHGGGGLPCSRARRSRPLRHRASTLAPRGRCPGCRRRSPLPRWS